MIMPPETMFNIAFNQDMGCGSSFRWHLLILEIIEKGIFKGEIRSIIKQAVYVVIAVVGANMGYGFIRLVQKCGEFYVQMKRLNTGCVIALITGLICGFLAGSVAISSLASYRIDLYKEK